MRAEYKCQHCGKDFTIDGENIHAIWPLTLHKGDDGKLHWSWRSKLNEDYHFYHDVCFEEVAGKLYMIPDRKDEI